MLFHRLWEALGRFGNKLALWAKSTETFSLGTGVKDACEALAQSLSLQPLKGSDVVANTATHGLKLFGQTISGRRVIAQIKMAYSSQTGVGLKITERNEEEGLAEMAVGSVIKGLPAGSEKGRKMVSVTVW